MAEITRNSLLSRHAWVTHLAAKVRAWRPTVRGLRQGSGLILLAFVVTHLANHALGLISLVTMESGRLYFLAFWRNPVVESIVIGAVLVHVVLALYAVYARRRLRMPLAEGAQLLLGLAIPPLLLIHILATRGLHQIYGLDDTYTWELIVLWLRGPSGAVRQLVVMSVVWLHACIGIHLWLRIKPWHSEALPYLLGVELLLPVLSALGFIAGGRELAQILAAPDAVPQYLAAIEAPSEEQIAIIFVIERNVLIGFAIVLATTLAARFGRQFWERRRGIVRLTYPSGRVVSIAQGPTVLEASRLNGIPHASVCGGRGRCSTCRVRVGSGSEQLRPPEPSERRVLGRIGAAPDVRLACQVRPTNDLIVTPLLPPHAGPREGYQGCASHHGQEREIAILFADIRGFTTLAEAKLPYDVVFILNRYFATMGSAIEQVDGRVDKFIGDGVMALFGVETTAEGAARQALQAARLMSLHLRDLNMLLAADLPGPLRIGIGIHAGPVIVGEMGYASATSLTAIGDAVNTASRLEAATKEFGAELVLSQRVADLAGIDLTAYEVRETQVRGRSETLDVRIVASARDLPEVGGRVVPLGPEARAV